ncbi:MAG: hypothetical protein LKG23_10650 [Nitrospira sp.]|nr:hypothetical protein [Nitrospira sp.]
MLAPIALFVYKRPIHTEKVLKALQHNPEALDSDLFVFADAAKHEAASEDVAAVRALIKSVSGFRSVTVIERETNLGLAASVISGVTELIGRYGNVIVLEDDVVPGIYFLCYMNAALDKYRNIQEVVSVHAYSYPVSCPMPETFFLRGADCWGWATWARGWRVFESDGAKLLAKLVESGQAKAFDLEGTYPYTQMLADQVAGRNDSWAIRWHAAAFLQGLLTLYPGSSQVQNIGTDGTGTHGGHVNAFSHASWGRPIQIGDIPVEENKQAREAFMNFLRSLHSSLPRRIWTRLQRMLCGHV